MLPYSVPLITKSPQKNSPNTAAYNFLLSVNAASERFLPRHKPTNSLFITFKMQGLI